MSNPESTTNQAAANVVTPKPWAAVWTLTWRELVRFFRQKNRVFGAVGQPIIFWLLFSAGLGQTFQLSGTTAEAGPEYRVYFFPGTIVMILLFTAIFATISIIEDRKEGFLQSVLVAPTPRWAMVLGKILGATILAWIQGFIFLLLVLTLDLNMSLLDWVSVTLFMFVISLALTGLGFSLAWIMDSTQGYHAMMSLLLFPMWLLSGAFFPVPVLNDASGIVEIGVHWIMKLNPLTYGVAGMRRLMMPAEMLSDKLPSWTVCLAITLIFAAATYALSWRTASRRISGDLL